MATELNPGGAASLDEAIFLRLLNNADVNILTDAEQAKLGHLTVTQAVDLDAMETRVNQLDAAVVLIGSWDASGGSFPGSGSAQAGHSYIVSVAGTVDSVAFAVGDRVIAITDDASTGTYAANWLKLDYTDQVLSVNGYTGTVVLDADDIDDAATTNKFATAAQLAKVDAVQAGAVAKTFEIIGLDCEGDPDAVRPTVAAGKPVYFFNHGNSNPTNMLNGDFAPGVPGTIKGGTKAASFTAALTDGGATYYTTDDASPVTCTLPLEATVDFPLMTSITLVQAGDAAAQFTVPAGATINGVDGGTVATSTKYKGGIAAVKIAADTWVATGDIA